MTDPVSPQFVTVARILRSRGNKGEVAAELLTDFPERLGTLREFRLAPEKGAARAIALKSFWVDRNHPGNAVFHFDGVSSIDEAEKLRGMEIQIPLEQRVSLPEGSYFVTDLIGCAVFALPENQSAVSSSPCAQEQVPSLIGKVQDVFFPGESQPGTPLLSVSAQGGELLVPLAQDICTKIDIAARRVEVRLPEGLRTLDE